MKKIIVLILSLFVSILVIKANEKSSLENDLYINELETTVNKYLKLPSFSGETKIIGINSTKRFKDENGIINEFEIEYSDIDASIIDNNLKVTAKEEGIYTIGFIKKSSGEISDIRFNVIIKVVSGSITVIAVDSENKNRLEANLENFDVDLYKGNIGYGDIHINENNSGSRYNLTFGEYKVKNGKTPYGYKFKPIEEWLYIWEGSYDIKVYLNYEIIKGNLIINKYCGEEIDNEAEFEIYHNDTLIKTIKANSYEELEFGTYLIRQVNGKKYYEFVDDFILTVDQEKDYVYELNSNMIKEVDEIINKKNSEVEELQQELVNKTEEILKYDELLLKKQNEISIYKKYLDKKESEIINYIEEIEILKNKLLKTEADNKELINQKKLIEENKDVLVVKVPDTYKKNNNKLISKIFIVIGLILIIINLVYKKKTIL